MIEHRLCRDEAKLSINLPQNIDTAGKMLNIDAYAAQKFAGSLQRRE